MSTPEEPSDEKRPVAWSTGPNPFAYVPGRALARGEDAANHLDTIAGRDHERMELGGRKEAPDAQWITVAGVEDPLATVALARADGFAVQPDHVFFAHDCDECCCGPHPWLTFDALVADPYRANPYRANPYRANMSQTSSAIPAKDRDFPPRNLGGPGEHPRITVLDTGLAEGEQLPYLLANGAGRITGDPDEPDSNLVNLTGTVFSKDTWLDPVAGHGTFIAGLIEQLAPGCTLHVERVISGLGDAIESDVVQTILAVAGLPDDRRPDMLSLSFGGNALAQAPALRSAIALAQLAGIVVVASAGNNATCEPQYPAAYDGVVAVGAVGPDGPTPWTNYGSWVDACAPGADLVSAFFAAFDGPEPQVNTLDPDKFEGWATWSGTSFAAPVVVAALAREMVLGNCGAKEAVKRVVNSPGALRIRCLGTVVTA
jgi:hypothetical protein